MPGRVAGRSPSCHGFGLWIPLLPKPGTEHPSVQSGADRLTGTARGRMRSAGIYPALLAEYICKSAR